ncbi:hypothetical protein Vadar_002434 [Vaccinium darrowii]|uniref:Uncharacterized protein n=1 Tax=Vaccinium darrowii TaxID=229202 RepID=A0ACB7XF53_9ERIC|nr:hypothetical protein Vadar_002434 [Vaccinium darrowii]
MRILGYEALGGFKIALEKCQKRKDLMRLRLLLTYLPNGIEEPWQRIPSITAKFVAEASVILLDPLHDRYSTISKFLISFARVNMKSVPLFASFLWNNSVNFRTDRLWMLRLLYAGLDSDDDARIYIRNNILEILLVFYASPLSDIESKELTLQEQDKLLLFVRWATSTALQSSSIKELQPTEAYCHSAILLEREQSEDSLLSKLLRWLTASVILGRLSLRFEKSNLETLHSLLELDKKGCGESQFGFGCEEILAACIFGLLPLLGMGCRLIPSVVASLSLLLFSDLLNLAGSEMNCLVSNENTLASLWSRVRCPIEANPSWRGHFTNHGRISHPNLPIQP